MTRQIVLDTETTGLEAQKGHRVVEIGAVEMIDRKPTGRHFHKYINPDRDIDDGAFEVHGLSSEFLSDKPRFEDIAQEFLAFVSGAELVIHNAGFDVGFLNYELAMLEAVPDGIESVCLVTDSLSLARSKHPGQKNNLDALCRRYGVDNSARTLHGALLDAEILADVYLAMTGGQTALFGSEDAVGAGVDRDQAVASFDGQRPRLKVILATDEEIQAHEAVLDFLEQKSGDCVWRQPSGS